MLAIVGVLESYISSKIVNTAYAAYVYIQRIAARTAPGPKQLGPIMSLAGLDAIVKCCIWTSRES